MLEKFKNISIMGDLLLSDPVSKKELKEALKEKNVSFNFKNVRAVDSTGMDIICNICQKIKKNGGKVKIVEVNNQILELFKICNLDRLAEIIPVKTNNDF